MRSSPLLLAALLAASLSICLASSAATERAHALPRAAARPACPLDPLPSHLSPTGYSRLLASEGSRDFVGVEPAHGAYQMWRVDLFECAAAQRVGIVEYAVSFHQPFYEYLSDRIWAHGAVPLLTWEPWSYATDVPGAKADPSAPPLYSLKEIISGKDDAYITGFATSIRRFGRPLLLRFAPEMNGNWNSWSESGLAERDGDYVRAWRHVHDLFRAAKAFNVLWVWAPNVDCGSYCRPLSHFYPGPAYVNVLALDGYNWGKVHPWTVWRPFGQIFDDSLSELARLAPEKPELVSETASTELGGSKADWMGGLVAGLDANPNLAGFVWFNLVKETDWRVQSSGSSSAAFRAALRSVPESRGARRLRRGIAAIEARYDAALQVGQLFP